MQAVILAAGMGKRLKELTRDSTKCMVKVNGVTLIQRMLNQLSYCNLSKVIIVVGFKAQELKSHISLLDIPFPIEYVDNDIYYKTNNIYSLFLAKDYLMQDDTLLLESDLIFEDVVLDRILEHPYPSLALVAKYENWMDGTVVTLDDKCNIKSFLGKKDFIFTDIPHYYKTVNIYKFSKEFSITHYVPFLEAYCKALGHNEYYEQVLKVITLLDHPGIKALPLGEERWYEIDDVQDLDIAESIFTTSIQDKITRINQRYGGYWRYPHMLDFCYLVNPFYPPQKLLNEIKANFERLAINYPSGQAVNSLLAAKYWGLQQCQIAVGNGAAELIKSLLEKLDGTMGTVTPTFEEYLNRKADMIAYVPHNPDFRYSVSDLQEFFQDKPIQLLCIVNPDNPSGNYIPKIEILQLAEWCKVKDIILILDESFVDFSDSGESGSLLNQEILAQYLNLVVVKSISKSFGVPGFRLGVVASGNVELMNIIKKDVSIWNINSLGEFFLQIFEKYQSEYWSAMQCFRDVRADYIAQLQTFSELRVIPSQANYIMCEIIGTWTTKELTQLLLDRYNILIKNLSGKKGINGEYIRIAVKTAEENLVLIRALRELLN